MSGRWVFGGSVMSSQNEPAITTSLLAQNERLEVRNADGSLVGYFLTETAYNRLVGGWAFQHTTEQEIETARQEPGRTLAEIWKNLD